jgi:shikimate dehydrogenase
MKKFAVIGHPVAHSLSPAIHYAFAKQCGLDLEYIKLDPGPGGFIDGLTRFHEQGGCGASVTLPFKQTLYAMADLRTPTAESTGAANTLWWNAAGQLHVDNTDGLGLVWDLQQRLSIVLKGARILLVGAGGAAAGILPSLLVEQPKKVYVANRTVDKAQGLIAHQRPVFSNCLQAVSLASSYDEPMDLVIHATALGHQDKTPVLSAAALGDKTFCYDLSYGHAAQPFLQWAAGHGVLYRADGIGMLVAQAALQFERWHGRSPDVRETLRQINPLLSNLP